MNTIIKVILILTITQGCVESKIPELKPIEDVKKVVLKKEGAEEFCYWEFENNELIWDNYLGETPALNKYKDSLKFALGEKKYKTSVNNESIQDLDSSLVGKETNGDKINALLVHSWKVGKIRRINYLESQILNTLCIK